MKSMAAAASAAKSTRAKSASQSRMQNQSRLRPNITILVDTGGARGLEFGEAESSSSGPGILAGVGYSDPRGTRSPAAFTTACSLTRAKGKPRSGAANSTSARRTSASSMFAAGTGSAGNGLRGGRLGAPILLYSWVCSSLFLELWDTLRTGGTVVTGFAEPEGPHGVRLLGITHKAYVSSDCVIILRFVPRPLFG